MSECGGGDEIKQGNSSVYKGDLQKQPQTNPLLWRPKNSREVCPAPPPAAIPATGQICSRKVSRGGFLNKQSL